MSANSSSAAGLRGHASDFFRAASSDAWRPTRFGASRTVLKLRGKTENASTSIHFLLRSSVRIAPVQIATSSGDKPVPRKRSFP